MIGPRLEGWQDVPGRVPVMKEAIFTTFENRRKTTLPSNVFDVIISNAESSSTLSFYAFDVVISFAAAASSLTRRFMR